MLSAEMNALRLEGFDLTLTGFDMEEVGKLPDSEPEPSDTTKIDVRGHGRPSESTFTRRSLRRCEATPSKRRVTWPNGAVSLPGGRADTPKFLVGNSAHVLAATVDRIVNLIDGVLVEK